MADSDWMKWICSVLEQRMPLSQRDIVLPVEPGKCSQRIQQLVDLLNELMVDHVCALPIDSGKSALLLSSDRKMKAYLSIKCGAHGALNKVDIIPVVPEIANVADFAMALDAVDPSQRGIYVVESGHSQALRSGADDRLPVASLVKVIVAAALCYKLLKERCDAGRQLYCLQKKDLSPFSIGFEFSDVGHLYSIADIAIRMLLMSDNTAMDILLRVIGDNWIRSYARDILGESSFENIQATKTTYGRTWNNRVSALSDVKWPHGIGYFFSLREIATSAQYFMAHKWVLGAYANERLNSHLFFKGGNEPGVISTVWDCQTNSGDFLLAFALDRVKAFSLLEQIYVHQCAWQLLKADAVVEDSSTLFFREGA